MSANDPAAVFGGTARWCTLLGDCRDTLRSLPDACVQTCVTSPPYYGLRDYGADGQIGLERSPAEYVAAMVEVMREARRVLRDDGTLWLNIGDSYAQQGGRGAQGSTSQRTGRSNVAAQMRRGNMKAPVGFKPKDLLGIPWRLAFALQDDGWWLRSDIVWAKPNPMPESVLDRPTRAHEFVFLLTKRARYFYNRFREPFADSRNGSPGGTKPAERNVGGRTDGLTRPRQDWIAPEGCDGRNARDVWTLAPEPYAGAHFATMPPELARRCIRAGSRRGDVVLDPFGGSGTTARVALEEGRRAVLCELNPEYVALQRERCAPVDTDAIEPIRVGGSTGDGPLFGGPLDLGGAR